ncbi:hypothetical protein INT45_006689 [Circinella minor]|uniref:Uncharacterized protein n=1 Tax=Circinella minor TaxID=1195481 RepID=A0A8H7S3E3_9FUNG|nr:hypothetical protein INT45_006689 [Circinella minor]
MQSYNSGDKGTWLKRIKNAAKSLNMSLKDATASWKRIDKRIVELNGSISNNNKESAGSNKPSISISPFSSSSSALKSKLTQQEKEKRKQNFNRLTKSHKKDFWIPDSTKERAIENGVAPGSVEEKVMQFALCCQYHHPSRSYILDVNDKTGMIKTPVEVFNLARRVDLNPLEDHLKVWFTTELQIAALLFFPTGPYNIPNCIEYEQLYIPFTNNNERQLSAIEPIACRKMGRRVDTLFKSGSEELGCSEIGAVKNHTKQTKDSNFKMPLVLRDMLLKLTYTEELLHSVHTEGYDMTGDKVVLLETDVRKGFVTRIRRTIPLEYPSSNENFTSRLLPLMNLALTDGKYTCFRATLAVF